MFTSTERRETATWQFNIIPRLIFVAYPLRCVSSGHRILTFCHNRDKSKALACQPAMQSELRGFWNDCVNVDERTMRLESARRWSSNRYLFFTNRNTHVARSKRYRRCFASSIVALQMKRSQCNFSQSVFYRLILLYDVKYYGGRAKESEGERGRDVSSCPLTRRNNTLRKKLMQRASRWLV